MYHIIIEYHYVIISCNEEKFEIFCNWIQKAANFFVGNNVFSSKYWILVFLREIWQGIIEICETKTVRIYYEVFYHYVSTWANRNFHLFYNCSFLNLSGILECLHCMKSRISINSCKILRIFYLVINVYFLDITFIHIYPSEFWVPRMSITRILLNKCLILSFDAYSWILRIPPRTFSGKLFFSKPWYSPYSLTLVTIWVSLSLLKYFNDNDNCLLGAQCQKVGKR